MLIEHDIKIEQDRQDRFRAEWVKKRYENELYQQQYRLNPELPEGLKQTLEFEARVLDVMITRLPLRAKLFGEEEVRMAHESVATAEFLIEDARGFSGAVLK